MAELVMAGFRGSVSHVHFGLKSSAVPVRQLASQEMTRLSFDSHSTSRSVKYWTDWTVFLPCSQCLSRSSAQAREGLNLGQDPTTTCLGAFQHYRDP